ncbi:L,D-transpeptidase scaffold domain-containing protein [Pedobacter endophyticus]|uniref:Peptidoglycan-binding protein n=1 Tax=Pedobacter endophyticus TaxID=2789740 RepID=A0A7S9Q0B9_9SPHI|nr:peptidoglycan-binding protein [Pedobacter endophyticus]QPH40596.1 peptidoglycan-binding protein [Pedobacter endophyticus]
MKQSNFITSLISLVLLSLSVKADFILSPARGMNDSTSVTLFHTDSSAVAHFIQSNQLQAPLADQFRQFYNDRQYQHAWVIEDGLSEQAQMLLNLYNQFIYYSGDSSLTHRELLAQTGLLQSEGPNKPLQSYSEVELQLTNFFIAFLARAYAGKIDPSNLQWHIPRKKIRIAALLKKFASSEDAITDNWLPISKAYLDMRAHVLRLKSFEQEQWKEISLVKRKMLQVGDTAQIIKTIKSRLIMLGDLKTGDTTSIYNQNLISAVEGFQNRHGLSVDAIIGPEFIQAVNIPIQAKLEQMLINMERMRWMPVYTEKKTVVVNIPEFKLHVFQDGDEVLNRMSS